MLTDIGVPQSIFNASILAALLLVAIGMILIGVQSYLIYQGLRREFKTNIHSCRLTILQDTADHFAAYDQKLYEIDSEIAKLRDGA